jgi:hypothetical protein
MATVRIQVRRGTAAQWTSANPTLAAGELGVESDTNLFKFGNGSSTWTALAYANNSDVAIGEISQDAINTALTMGAGLTKTYNDGANTITITVDSSVVALKTYVDSTALTAKSEAIADAGTAADTKIETHRVDTTDVHGIADTSVLATATTVATAKSEAIAAAGTAADTKVSNGVTTHNNDTTDVHGIADTSLLLTTTSTSTVSNKTLGTDLSAGGFKIVGLATPTGNLDAATKSYVDTSIADLVEAAPATLNTLNELAAALGDDAAFSTTITNSIATKLPLAGGTMSGNLNMGGTNIVTNLAAPANVGDAANKAYVDGLTSTARTDAEATAASALSTHTADTTNVHGIADTSLLATTANVATAKSEAISQAVSDANTYSNNLAVNYDPAGTALAKYNLATAYADSAVSTEVTNRNTAITNAIGTEVNDRNTAIGTHSADTTLVHGIADTSLLATMSYVDTAEADAITAAGTAADSKVAAAVAALTKSSVGLANVDNTADASKPVSTAQASAIATAKSEAIADATSQVNALLTGAPAALNTLDELAAALGDDANFASTVTTSLGLKAPLASPTFTGTVTVAASGVAFTDATQTKAGVPSLTTIATATSGAYNLSTGGLTLRDQLIPVGGTHVITVPTNTTTAYPVGTTISFYQSAGTGGSFAAADGTVTILSTPGSTLRALYSSATLTKVATNTWLLAGDLKA